LYDTNLLIEEPDYSRLSDPDEEIEVFTSALCYADDFAGIDAVVSVIAA